MPTPYHAVGFPFRFGPGACCCPRDCWDWADDFDREDSDDPGPNWNEDTGAANGNWGIYDQMLVEEWTSGGVSGGTANAIILCKQSIPVSRDNGMTVAITAVDAAIGDKFHIYAACPSDESVTGAVKVEYEKTDTDKWVTTIIGGGADGISETQTASPQAPSGRGVILWVCTDNLTNMVKAGIVSLSGAFAWVDDMDPGSGRYAALGHDSATNGVLLDNFYISEIRTPHEICYDCWCWCLLRPPGRYLTATIFDATHRAGCLGGVTWDMDWEWNGGIQRWRGTAQYPHYDTGTIAVLWTLLCASGADAQDESHPGKNFELYTDDTACFVGPGGTGPFVPIAADSSCDPLQLVFGPFTLTWSDLTCNACFQAGTPEPPDTDSSGQYYIVITDA